MNNRSSSDTSDETSRGLAGLSPAYFGMVMATGIVSLAAWQSGLSRVASALVVLNVAVYLFLLVLNIIRLLRFPRCHGSDLIDLSDVNACGTGAGVLVTSQLSNYYRCLGDGE